MSLTPPLPQREYECPACTLNFTVKDLRSHVCAGLGGRKMTAEEWLGALRIADLTKRMHGHSAKKDARLLKRLKAKLEEEMKLFVKKETQPQQLELGQ